MSGAVFLLRLPAVTISEVKIVGVRAVSNSELLALAQQSLTEKYFGFLSKRSILTAPRGSIRKKVLDTYPEIKSASVRQKGLTSLSLEVSERAPIGLWCAGAKEKQETSASSTPCYFMDDLGYIFASAPLFDGSVFIVYTGLITKEVPLRETYSITPSFAQISTFAESLRKEGIRVVSISADVHGEKIMTLEHGIKIFLNDSLPLSKVKDNLNVTLNEIGYFKEAIRPNIEYVDLRFGNKVFFKKILP